MDKVIQNYHGFGPTDKHVSNMNAKELNAPPFAPDEDAMINSTRIRVARNLYGFPLGAGQTRTQRKEVEAKIVEALKSFTGDLAGEYYPLTGMTPEIQ